MASVSDRFPFSTIAIVNRGEPAVRLLHAARELADERAIDLRIVALYTEPDAASRYVREADDRYSLGPAMTTIDGARKSAYLDYARLEQALEKTGADAVWVGWGFVAEDPQFAEMCERIGVTFIGPPGAVMRRLGDKITAKRLATEAGVPVAPWSNGPVESVEAAQAAAAELGFPLMVKASAGGGGRGIRLVRSADALADAFTSARSEAGKAFGDDTVFLEKLVKAARHVEVQVVADKHGNCWALGVRDCTVQRRHQKLIEEAPSPALPPERTTELLEASRRLALAASYVNVGTVECLYDVDSDSLCFMEMNTRLQVEHPVTEQTTGVDLVKLQLRIAAGEKLVGDPPPTKGHSIEARIAAEDPDVGFAPAPGRVEVLRAPTGPGVRVDCGINPGDEIGSDFDSMVAKVITTGRDRTEALSRLRRALGEMTLLIDGGTSNKAFLLDVLHDEAFIENRIDVRWLDRRGTGGAARAGMEIALCSAAVAAYEAERAAERVQFIGSSARGRPQVREEVGLEVELGAGEHSYKLLVFKLGPDAYRVSVDGHEISLRVEQVDRYESWLWLHTRRHRVLQQSLGLGFRVEVDGQPFVISRDDGGAVRAPAPSVVVSVRVSEGDVVAAGDPLLVLEAMKTEMPVLAPAAGRVREVLVSPAMQVGAAAKLIVLEALADDGDGEATADGGSAPLSFEALADPTEALPDDASNIKAILRDRYHRNLDDLRPLVLGYDVGPEQVRRLLGELRALAGELPAFDEATLEKEQGLLQIFVDIIKLHGAPSERGASADVRLQQYMHAYLRSLSLDTADLPEDFVDQLERTVAHYGVDSLERSLHVEEAVLSSYRAYRSLDSLRELARLLLERWSDSRELTKSKAQLEQLTMLLDRLALAATRLNDITDLARQVYYRHVDWPELERRRDAAHAEIEALVERAAGGDAEATTNGGLDAIIDCEFPLESLLSPWLREGSSELRAMLARALLSRFYSGRLSGLEVRERDGFTVASAYVNVQKKRQRLYAVYCPGEAELPAALSALRQAAAEAKNVEVVLDVILDGRGSAGSASGDDDVAGHVAEEGTDALAERLIDQLQAAELAGTGAHVCFTLLGAPSERGAREYLTFELADGDVRERRRYRGIHAMHAFGLAIWRLAEFDVKRLPSGPDVYVFDAVARDSERDRRLFTYVDVAQLRPERDAAGRLRLPHFARMFYEAMAHVRDARDLRSGRGWNRVCFTVGPALDFPLEDLHAVVQHVAPSTLDLGIEQVVVRVRVPHGRSSALQRDVVLRYFFDAGWLVRVDTGDPPQYPLRAMSPYDLKVMRCRSRGMTYPYELIRRLTPHDEGTSVMFSPGRFVEYELEGDELVPVDRSPGGNVANVVVGVIDNFTSRYPEGMRRVIVFGDPTRGMGALAEPECRRVIAALDLAEKMGVPLDWFPISAGAKIALDSGTENLDWTARVLRRLIEFCEHGEVNVVVHGINVGAQSYWNAEATMLLHTRGILVMTEQASMVLTGKRALDYSGSVSADTNAGIGGPERIMGPNGQAQYVARDLSEACLLLFYHHELTYRAPGERFPRRLETGDPVDRDPMKSPHDGEGFSKVGEVFSDETNPARKRPFAIRSVMAAVADRDHLPLERWAQMRDAEVAVVQDVSIGGYAACLIGIESRTVPRAGMVPGDGPTAWTGGTLFPLGAKKIARAINAASGSRPVVVLANLSGFDGSPDSMRRLQLEYGAELGRAVVRFDGPLLFCVLSRYHGGAYVVFSRALNDDMHAFALEGARASVIGGAPAAAVVLVREVRKRALASPAVVELSRALDAADEATRPALRAQLHEATAAAMAEQRALLADEFDGVHTVERARDVGSLDAIVDPTKLRSYLVQMIESGQEGYLQRLEK